MIISLVNSSLSCCSWDEYRHILLYSAPYPLFSAQTTEYLEVTFPFSSLLIYNELSFTSCWQLLPAGVSLWFSSSESAKTSASSWSDMSVSSVRSRRSKCTSREETLLSGSTEEQREQQRAVIPDFFSADGAQRKQLSEEKWSK